MAFISKYISYKQTGSFSKIVEDYLSAESKLRPFYTYAPEPVSIKAAIADRAAFKYDRATLVEEFSKQYSVVDSSGKVAENIRSLLDPATFTVCTAHQPNIFTGHLYFIYKIVHTIKLADRLNQEHAENHFVPVYYMGSEDADLEELGEITVNGMKYRWETNQAGAVGRMLIDESLMKIIDQLESQLSSEKFGKEIIQSVRNHYVSGRTIEDATFRFVNALFSEYGLLILLPDNPNFKKLFKETTVRELTEKFSNKELIKTLADLGNEYKIQAEGREINLFYLHDGIRERIEASDSGFRIANTNIRFTLAEIKQELNSFPERFSANVILRPLYQEMLLPNVAFIGGGGELAYWLELKNVFSAAGIPFPVLLLRNSFMLLSNDVALLTHKLGIDSNDLFKAERDLVIDFVKRNSTRQLNLETHLVKMEEVYNEVKMLASDIDPTLEKHVSALSKIALGKIKTLEQKMIRAERKHYDASERQIKKVRSQLFPGNSLQERVENLLPFYARYGKDFIKEVYESSGTFEQTFCLMEEKPD